MTYYLHHYFDPNFDHTALKPRPLSGGKADLRNLGYVQNVLPGQILAELIPLEYLREENANLDPRFILEKPEFPAGRHTGIDPDNPLRLTARAAGYVFYENGRIAVKTLLNIRGNVDFRTGNIDFVGNIHVHHDIASGFWIKGNDILVDGGINNSMVRARNNLLVRGGVRGDMQGSDPRGRCILVARKNMRLFFVNKAELRAGNNLEINQALHSILLAGGNLLVEKNLIGGICRVQDSVAIQGDLGNSAFTATRLFLGPHPFFSRALHRNQERLDKQRHIEEQCAPLADHLPADANDCSRRLARARRLMAILERQQVFLRIRLDRLLEFKQPSRLFVGGTIFPGVYISINGVEMQINDPLRHVSIRQEGDHLAFRDFAKPPCFNQQPASAG